MATIGSMEVFLEGFRLSVGSFGRETTVFLLEAVAVVIIYSLNIYIFHLMRS
jgi:hypothetical protein